MGECADRIQDWTWNTGGSTGVGGGGSVACSMDSRVMSMREVSVHCERTECHAKRAETRSK